MERVGRTGGGLGGRLLKEVRASEGSLNEFLSTLRSVDTFRTLDTYASNTILYPIFNLPHIDHLLQQALYDLAQRAAQEHHDASTSTSSNINTRKYNEYGLVESHEDFPILHPAIVEISSEKSCTGKTHLLYSITAALILPEECGGKQGAVIVIDCDGRFGGCDMSRLRDVVTGHLITAAHTAGVDITEEYVDKIVTESMNHVHIFRPQSSAGILATLEYIPTYLFDKFKHFSSDRSLECIMIDGISAFYRLDKLTSFIAHEPPLPPSIGSHSSDGEEEEPKEEEEPLEEEEKFSIIEMYNSITIAIQKVSRLLSAPVVITNIKIHTGHEHNKQRYPTHLPTAYTYGGFLTARIILTMDSVSQFYHGISLKEAWGDRHEREVMVQQAGFSGWVESTVRKKGPLKNEGGWFWFHISDGGVIIKNSGDE